MGMYRYAKTIQIWLEEIFILILGGIDDQLLCQVKELEVHKEFQVHFYGCSDMSFLLYYWSVKDLTRQY